jgi:hypothetical protein
MLADLLMVFWDSLRLVENSSQIFVGHGSMET